MYLDYVGVIEKLHRADLSLHLQAKETVTKYSAPWTAETEITTGPDTGT